MTDRKLERLLKMEKLDITLTEATECFRDERPEGWKFTKTNEKVRYLIVRYRAVDRERNEYTGSVDIAWPTGLPVPDAQIESAVRADINEQRATSSQKDFLRGLVGKKLGGL